MKALLIAMGAVAVVAVAVTVICIYIHKATNYN